MSCAHQGRSKYLGPRTENQCPYRILFLFIIYRFIYLNSCEFSDWKYLKDPFNVFSFAGLQPFKYNLFSGIYDDPEFEPELGKSVRV